MLRNVEVSLIIADNTHNHKQYKKLSTQLQGSSVDSNIDIKEFADCTVSLPDAPNRFGLIDLKMKNNFIILLPFNISTSDNIQMCYYESQHICKWETSSRAGSAGSIILSDTNSHSLTSCTKKTQQYSLTTNMAFVHLLFMKDLVATRKY
jgi:hypothetical protein